MYPATQLRLVDVRELSLWQFDPFLAEEAAEWSTELDWDFAPVAALIRRLAGERRLSGAALMAGRELAGCGYVAVQARKGLIVDAWIRSPWRDGIAGPRLFRALFGSLVAIAEVRRIEAQLMLFEPPGYRYALAGSETAPLMSRFDRLLMRRAALEPLPAARKPPQGYRIQTWDGRHMQAAGTLLAASRKNHVDSDLSDSYRSRVGAASLIESIVEPKIPGTFCEPASFLAFDIATSRPAGLVLAGFTAAATGHIAELSLASESQGRGLGYELLRASLDALKSFGADRVSLSVTAANEHAVAFYRKCGFRELRRFPAYAWDRAPSTSPTSGFRSTAVLSPSPDS